MNFNSITNISISSSSSSKSSFEDTAINNSHFVNYDSSLKNSIDHSQLNKLADNSIVNQHLQSGNCFKEKNNNFQSEELNTHQPSYKLDQYIYLNKITSNLENKTNKYSNNIIKEECNHKGYDFLKVENNDDFLNDDTYSESQDKFLGINARRDSKKVEKYIYAISKIDEEIHKCTQNIDSKRSFLNQSRTEFLKIQNKIDLIQYKIEKEKKNHQIILTKYKNEFKRLAKERNEIGKRQFENQTSNYQIDRNMTQRYNQIQNSKQELKAELKSILSKKTRSNNRLERMECQLQRLIRAEMNLKNKSKKITKRDKKESVISSLLDKLEQKLNDKQIKKDREFRKDQIETQILLQTFDNIQQTIKREANNEVSEQIVLPVFPFKVIQNKSKKEANIEKISDEIQMVQNDIKFLKKEIQKLTKSNDKYKIQILELHDKNKNQDLSNNHINIYHNENINLIYQNAKNYIPSVQNEISQLSFNLNKKKHDVDKKRRKILSRCENYFTIIYEYGKKWQE